MEQLVTQLVSRIDALEEQVSRNKKEQDSRIEEQNNRIKEQGSRIEEQNNHIKALEEALNSLAERLGDRGEPPSNNIVNALRGLVGIVMQTVRSSETPVVKSPERFGVLLEEPFHRAKVALAYNMVLKAAEEAAEEGPAHNKEENAKVLGRKENAKLLGRIMRDLLVLLVCGSESTGPWDNARLKWAMNNAFGVEVDEPTMSQMYNAFNKILVFGQERAKFDAKVAGGPAPAYGTPLEAELAGRIFAAFAECARGSPQFVSKAKTSRRAQRGPKGEAAAEAGEAAAEAWEPAAEAWEPMYLPVDSHTRNPPYAHNLGSSAEFGEPWLVNQICTNDDGHGAHSWTCCTAWTTGPQTQRTIDV